MTPQTRNSTNGIKKSLRLDGTQSLSQLERRGALERGKRVCIVCGKLSPISESVVYPKSKQRRLEFTNALKLPLHVSEALPFGCFICGDHFRPADIEFSTSGGHAQVSDFAVPCLSLDHEFLNTLRALKSGLEPRSAIRAVKRKLGWDFKPSLTENECESDQSQDSNDDSNNTLVSTLFGNPEFRKTIKKSRKRENLRPQLQPPFKTIRLVPISDLKLGNVPPVLEKMDDHLNDQPPALSPVLRKSQRTKSLKDLPQLEVSNLIPTTSRIKTKDEQLKESGLTIQRLRQALKQKTTELDLVKKKLKVTEELLQFYQDNNSEENNACSNEFDQAPDLLPHLSECRNSISDNDEEESNQNDEYSPKATAMLLENNQSDLQQHLDKLLKTEHSD